VLCDEYCSPCAGGAAQLDRDELDELRQQLPCWQLQEGDDATYISRRYQFHAYQSAVCFVHQVADLAEQYNHHPRIQLERGCVTVAWWTHTIAGLHRNDFILAAKTDVLFDGHRD